MEAFKCFVWPRTEIVVETVDSTTKKVVEWTVRGETGRSLICVSCIPPVDPRDSRNDNNNSDDLSNNNRKTTRATATRTTATAEPTPTAPLKHKSIFTCRHVQRKRLQKTPWNFSPTQKQLSLHDLCGIACLVRWYACNIPLTRKSPTIISETDVSGNVLNSGADTLVSV